VGDGAPRGSTRRGVLAYAAALAGVFGLRVFTPIAGDALQRAFDAPGATWFRDLVIRAIAQPLVQAYHASPSALLAGTLLLLAGVFVRAFARARLREGRPDPLERVREQLARRPWMARLLTWIPSLAFVLYEAWDEVLGPATRNFAIFRDDWMRFQTPETLAASIVIGTAVVALAIRPVASAGLRALLAPIAPGRSSAKGADEIAFSAVAVTVRTRAAVAGLAAASVAAAIAVACVPYHALHSDPRVLFAMGVYVAAALGAMLAFRRSSRIDVGVDGIYVHYGAHTRFFAYRDIDGARTRAAGLELLRGERVVLHLQLHGPDADRRDELLDRIRRAIAHARDAEAHVAERVVQTTSTRRVASATLGGADYRFPAISREQLWSVVEGSSADAPTRTAAAQALAVDLAQVERPRLRAVAARTADPQLRVALDRLTEPEEEASDVAQQRGRQLVRR
jgi:hypothetical protein